MPRERGRITAPQSSQRGLGLPRGTGPAPASGPLPGASPGPFHLRGLQAIQGRRRPAASGLWHPLFAGDARMLGGAVQAWKRMQGCRPLASGPSPRAPWSPGGWRSRQHRRNAWPRAPDAVTSLNSPILSSGPKTTEIWDFLLLFTYISQSVLCPASVGFKKELCCHELSFCHPDKKDWSFHISYYSFYHLEAENYIHGQEETAFRRVALFSLYKSVYLFHCVHFYILLLTL